MRFSVALTAAFAAGAVAKPHHARRAATTCASKHTAVAAADVSASSSGAGSEPVVVPVPPAVSNSSPSGILSSLAPLPTGSNSTIPLTSGNGLNSGNAQSSGTPQTSGIAQASSEVPQSITSAALPAASSAAVSDSEIPYGEVIYSCTVPGTFALTFDDGPYNWTNHVLDLLSVSGLKVTFFLNGDNYGNINDFATVVRRMIDDGHQIGSHTYNHADLSNLGDADVIKEMTDLEDDLEAIIGKIPTYMRPPYFSYTDRTLALMKELGYHVIQANIDTFDYQFDTMGDLTGSNNLDQGIANGGNLALAHDVHENTAEVLVPAFIKSIQAAGLRGVPVGECLGDAAENWYITRRTATPTAPSGPFSTVSITSTVTPTGVVATDGSCGGTTGFVCLAGNCCSQYGYCGTSKDYCVVGCQEAFGVCGVLVEAGPLPTGAAPAPTGVVSPDGTCGGTAGYACAEGTCCSQYGYCGTTDAHCGDGCQTSFGVCGINAGGLSSGVASGAAPAPTAGSVSPDGSCGGTLGYTCTEGNCCSEYGYCGTTTAHCGVGCQSAFGICT